MMFPFSQDSPATVATFDALPAMPDSIRGTFAHDTSPKWLAIFRQNAMIGVAMVSS